jgi:hypothetical protein
MKKPSVVVYTFYSNRGNYTYAYHIGVLKCIVYVLWIINDLLAPLSLFFHEFQQNSQFLRTISNDLGRVAYNHEISSI